MLRPVALSALLLTVLFAGCADPPKDSDEAEPSAFNDVQVTDTTGAIRGVVVSEAIVPIAGVAVRLVDGRNQTTDAEGAFVFNGLAPGDYFVTASKQGHITQQQSVTVVAGQREPPVTKILLPLDPGARKPFYEEYQFDGFIQCSGTFVAVAAAVCSLPNIFTPEPVTQDNFGIVYNMTERPSWMQSELVWDSTQATGNKMAVMYSWGDCDGFLCDHDADGTSPVLLVATPEDIDEINDGDYNDTGLFVRVFNRGLDETMGRVGATVNQQFTIYSHFFYGYAPPEGWRFSEDSTVPQPPQ